MPIRRIDSHLYDVLTSDLYIRHMAPLPPREQRHPFLRYQGLEYTDVDIANFEERLERIHDRDTYRVQVVDFQGMPELMRDVLDARMLMEHYDDGGVVLLDLDDPGTIQFRLCGARRRTSWRQFILTLGLHTVEEMELPSFARYWSESERMIPGKGDLCDYWRSIITYGDFLGPPPSYTLIKDPVLRLCHRMMAHSNAGRSQAPEKVTVTDLFYLRGLDVGSVNIPYLLACYLRIFVARRKNGALIFGGQFVARLAEHFRLLMEERLRGLTVTAPTLSVIDMAELVRLQICEEINDTWAWVALGPERQPDAAIGTPGAAEDAPDIDEGDQAVLAPVQAPPPPPTAAKTMPQRMARLEEDVHEIHEALAEQREVISAMARDFSKFTVWAASGIAQLLDSAKLPIRHTLRPMYHTRGASDAGLMVPAPPQPSRTSSCQTHDPSILYLLILSSVHLYYLYHVVPKTAYHLTYILWYDVLICLCMIESSLADLNERKEIDELVEISTILEVLES
ncbi:hypothetical protein Tco_0562495 [Tanacetum coccineum]